MDGSKNVVILLLKTKVVYQVQYFGACLQYFKTHNNTYGHKYFESMIHLKSIKNIKEDLVLNN